MRAKSKTKTTIPEKKQSGFCCASIPSSPKNTASKIPKPDPAEGQGSSVNKSAGI